MTKKINWEKASEYAKNNIEWALTVVDAYFGDYETSRKDNCLEERRIAFQEILRVIMPTAFNCEIHQINSGNSSKGEKE